MKVFYLTIAQDKESYKNYLSKWSVSPNLSNQNFHNKLIRSIALSHEVNVISIRPINRNFSEKSLQKSDKTENNVNWNYIKVSSNKVDKLLFTSNRVDEFTKNITKDDVLFVDALNLSLLKQAVRIKKKYGARIIGICTDNPSNISFTSDSYKNNLLSLGRELDEYIVLTRKLNDLYNISNKPYIIIDGVNELCSAGESKYKIDGDYIYFGGSLMRRYGVYNLIEAFNNLNNPNLRLVLCGHHEEPDLKDNIKKENILYLGALPNEEVMYLESHALCAVNPRPVDPSVDEYSIPSKTLEYLSCGTIAITVKNDLLMERYGKAILWSETGNVKDLENALNVAIKMDKKERESFIKNALETVNKYTSLEVINKEINKLF